MTVSQLFESSAGSAKKRTKKGDKTAAGLTSGEEGSGGEGLTMDENQTLELPARPRRSGLRARVRATEPQSDVDQAMDQDEPTAVTPKLRPRPKPRPVYQANPPTAPSASELHEPSPEMSPVVVAPEVNGFETPKAPRKRARPDGEEDEQRSTTYDGDTGEDGEHPSDLLTPPGDEIQFRRKRVRH
jgi:cohesin complex subunit SA-1/2